jgi:ribosomal protein L37E
MTAAVDDPDVGTACPRCGAHLAENQDWCLECGNAATTRIRRPPDWRVPLVAAALVLALVGGALAVAFVSIAGDDTSSTATRAGAGATPAAAAPTAAAAPAASTPPATATTPPAGAAPGAKNVAAWPAGTRAWTVTLASEPSRPAAVARARALADTGVPAGVLHSDLYPGLPPGQWLVFAGQYPSRPAADAAATSLRAKSPGARPQLIRPR